MGIQCTSFKHAIRGIHFEPHLVQFLSTMPYLKAERNYSSPFTYLATSFVQKRELHSSFYERRSPQN